MSQATQASALDHAITLKDVLMASGAVIGFIVVVGIVLGILAVLASGWNH